MTKYNNTIAICYDFDGTLAPGNMQEHDFIPNKLQMDKITFWNEVNQNSKKNNMDGILSYLELTINKSKEKGIRFNKQSLQKYGKSIEFFKGVEKWFDRINRYSKKKNMTTEHYIISSGIKPIIEGSRIQKNFKYIFACDFKYDAHGVARHPAVAINYTNKTQYLFRINKGVLNNWDDTINEITPNDERIVPFSNMIYIGDGITDIPSMKMINLKGGYSISVYDPQQSQAKENCQNLLKSKRCSFTAPANYQDKKALDKITKLLIDKISAENNLKKYQHLTLNN